MKKVKVGIVGTGFIGPVHIEALRRLKNVEVIALSGSSQEKAEKKRRFQWRRRHSRTSDTGAA